MRGRYREGAAGRRTYAGTVPIELTTLTDGGQPATKVAAEIAAFLNDARASLDLALYDVRLETEAGALVLASLLAAHQRGVRVRLLFDVDHPGPIPVPPPPETRPEALEALPVETRGIARDPRPHAPQVLRARRPGRLDGLDELDRGLLDAPGERRRPRARLGAARVRVHARVRPALGERRRRGHRNRPAAAGELDGGIEIRPWFTPGFGDALSHRVAKHLGRARERIRIASPVLTAGPILGTLAEVVNEGRCGVVGVVDDTQVDDVVRQWSRNRVSAWKLPLLHAIVEKAGLSGKPSTPWSPDGVQDFMHAKVVVADDVSFVGSFNFSRSGERNAENVLEIHDPATADTLARYVEEVAARYPRATLPEARRTSSPGRRSRASAPNPRP